MKRKLNAQHDALVKYRKKLRFLQQKNRRLQRKVKSISDIVQSLQKKALISDSCAELLETTFSGVHLQLMKRLLGAQSQTEYHPTLKAFALTLQFYSTKAYEYVRKTFGLGLPSVSTIRRWLRSVDGSAGFNEEALLSLERKVNEAKFNGKEVLCSLMIDEMSIKKHLEFDGNKTVGFVDIGSGITDDSAPPATEALVFMVVCVNGSWKVPVGYFLIHGLSGIERANLIRQCLLLLADVGVRVISLTCDGPSCHMSMLKDLGASLNPNQLDPSFPHPSSGERVFVLLDVCHMLKLLRNSFATCGLLKDAEGNIIRWQYLEYLHQIQEKEGLHLANKLRQSHMCWQAQKMKVKLAAQTLSKSVADALEYCRDGLRLPEFENCHATVRFLRTVDQLFDVLNSRNKFAKGMKGALKPDLPNGDCSAMSFLDNAFAYIQSLKDVAGNLMYTTPKRTAFIGFMAAIKATKALFKQYVGENKPLEYLLTYKLSQDHLELFFGAIRAYGGANNNPTVRQFVAAYKRMTMRHDVTILTGNIRPQDRTALLTSAGSSSVMRNAVDDDSHDIMVARRYALESPAKPRDADLADTPDMPELSVYRESAVGYIAGFVSRMVSRTVNCPDCQAALTVKALDGSQPSHGLVLQKDTGGLVKPSESVVAICMLTEKLFQRMLFVNKQRLPQDPGFPGALAHSVLEQTGGSVFRSLEAHMLDTEPDNNHVFSLIKALALAYCKIRMHHLVKQQSTLITGNKIRKTMSKLILFRHQ